MKLHPCSKKHCECESGVSTVVAAVLMLGLFVSVMAIINVSYVPQWKGDAEYAHMGDVYGDMSTVKSNADLMALAMGMESSRSFSMTMPVVLGGGYIPVFGGGKSSGSLSLNDERFDMIITAENDSNGTSYRFEFNDLGSLKYVSHNRYFVDQAYIVENGALIVVQNGRSLMKLSPGLTMKTGGNDVSISVLALEFSGPATTVTSNDVEYVRFTSDDSTVLFNSNETLSAVNITLNTNNPRAWVQFLNTSVEKGGVDALGAHQVRSNDTSVSLELSGGSINGIELYVQKDSLNAQINPLWVAP